MACSAVWSRRANGFAIVVHGGAGEHDPGRRDEYAGGCLDAVRVAARALESGARAYEAACEAVRCLEDNPLYNAGTGAALDVRGELALDASVMCGTDLRAGAVCALPAFRHPIAIARALLEEGKTVLLAGEGARAWALAKGFAEAEPASMITARARERLGEVQRTGGGGGWAGGTVGCVVRDVCGRFGAATSTGGLVAKPWGRIGDSPIVGAGTYADDEAGAVSNTGDGEAFLRACGATSVVEQLRAGRTAEVALRSMLERVQTRLRGLGGSIAIDHAGTIAWARTTRSMAWAALGEDWPAPEAGI